MSPPGPLGSRTTVAREGAAWLHLVDALVFSSLWLAATAAALAAAASRGMGVPADLRAVALAAAGTLVVYNVDRLRDVDRDRFTAPRRTAFVESHRSALLTLTAAGAVASGVLALAAGPKAIALLAPAGLAGLLHRRLKRFALAKPLYVVASWLLVVVGLPWVLAAEPRHLGWVLAAVGAAVLANAIASNVRDHEAGAALIGPARALAIARLVAVLGTATAVFAPPPLRPLAAMPAVVFAVLVPFRATERYGLTVVDGALLAGALLTLLSP